MGKDRGTTPTADSQRACASHTVSSESIAFARHISHGERAGREAVIAPLGAEKTGSLGEAPCRVGQAHSGRGGPTRMSWLLLPYSSLRASAGLGSSLSRRGLDLAARPALGDVGGAALPAPFPHPGRGDAAFHTGPTPSLPAAGPAFVHCLCVTAGREPVGGTDAHPFPRGLSNDVKGSQKALAVHRVWKK